MGSSGLLSVFPRLRMYMKPQIIRQVLRTPVLPFQLHSTQIVYSIPALDFRCWMKLYIPLSSSNSVTRHTHAHVALDRVYLHV